MKGIVTAAAGRHPQLQGPPLQHEPCSVPGAGLFSESVASMCPGQCSMPLIACAGVWARSADMRAQAIGALKILRAKAKSARKSLDLRPDIERARCDPKSLLGYIPKIKPRAGRSM